MITLLLLVPALLVGACFGSFLNVCIHRLPRGESVVQPPSRCERCGTALQWSDNLPLIGYLLLRGRCRYCGVRYGARYWIMELLVALLSGLIVLWVLHPALQIGGIAQGPLLLAAPSLLGPWGLMVAIAALAAVVFYAFVAAVIDIDHMIIPDELCLPMQVLAPVLTVALMPLHSETFFLWPTTALLQVTGSAALSLAALWFVGGGLLIASLPVAAWLYGRFLPEEQAWRPEDWRAFRIGLLWFVAALVPAVLAGVVCLWPGIEAAAPWSRWTGFLLAHGVLGSLVAWSAPYGIGLLGTAAFRRNAMGYGDVKFLAPIGAITGPVGVVYTIFFAAVAGTLVGLPARLLGGGREIPFGPWLALGALLTIVIGPWLQSCLFPYLA